MVEHTQKSKQKRTLSRNRNYSLNEIQRTFARLFTGNGSEKDASVVLQELDFFTTSMKITRDSKSIEPDPTACVWQAANINFVNMIHNMIQKGLDADNITEEEQAEIDRNQQAYDEPIRGVR